VAVVVPDEDVLAEAERTAARLAVGPTRALGRIKRLLAEAEQRDLDGHLDSDAVAIAASAADPEVSSSMQNGASR
jgi:2-(1,2-epoxy-1,2-dihydrophenyl)acetyl-CoA isomerase